WASTSTKNPKYRDVIYVEELIGPDTVNTMPLATLEAFRDHGKPRASLEENVEAAQAAFRNLEAAGISITQVTDRLVEEGVQLFVDAFEKLLAALERKCRPQVDSRALTWKISAEAGTVLEKVIAEWKDGKKIAKLWARDASVWTGKDEGKWLGWLTIVQDQLAHLHHLTDLAQEAHDTDFSDVLLLGMGGSSLAPEVMATTFGTRPNFPRLHVLDSTDPSQIRAIESKLDLGDTLFIVSSKSGTTLEPNILMKYFFDRVQHFDADNTGDRFIAVTDPGSKLQKEAEEAHFRHIYFGLPSIGGRYSALSDFGMVPSAIAGIDVKRVLDGAEQMAQSCASCVPEEENPGLILGALLGTLGNAGRDKVTILASPGIETFGAWLEQLLAESTGKNGKGLIPVDREPLGPPAIYGQDRVFVYLSLRGAVDASQESAIAAIEQAGHPVVRITLADIHDIGQEYFRWEVATAVAGSILGINPFDQPDVEASKIATRELTSEYEKTGKLKSGDPVLESDPALVEILRKHLSRIRPGDYFAVLAYLERNAAHDARMQAIRVAVRDTKRVATCVGFGPRFLHSTGQAYKGGPNSGVFLQLTCDEAADLPVPGQRYSFGVVKAAQALGDLQVLTERGRRALRIHLGADVEGGLARLESAIRKALS
ncbi:MAG TPA: bifunctional transaldolase/phosoglucose isomerase, partial [Bryobacteraceae bacterium]|nr:bifunctional transaldolase/phosoglucose isomerase [Bryobacteraceae bacterium]